MNIELTIGMNFHIEIYFFNVFFLNYKTKLTFFIFHFLKTYTENDSFHIFFYYYKTFALGKARN